MESDDLVRNFLVLRYRSADFLVNRNQFSASTSIENLPAGEEFLFTMAWGERMIPVLNLNGFLTERFRIERRDRAVLSLIIRRSDLTSRSLPTLEAFYREWADRQELGEPGEFCMGLIISSQAKILALPLGEIHRSPLGLRDSLERKGVYGCRFPRPERIQYFIDLELMLLEMMEDADEHIVGG